MLKFRHACVQFRSPLYALFRVLIVVGNRHNSELNLSAFRIFHSKLCQTLDWNYREMKIKNKDIQRWI